MWSLVMYSNYFNWNSVKIDPLTRNCSSVVLLKVCLYSLLYHYTIKIMIKHGIIFVAPDF